MSKIFYDCEFLDDAKTIYLISIGMVNYDTGDTYYAVSNEFNTRAVAKNKWLMNNVMSSIPHDRFLVCDFDGAPFVRDIFPTGPDVKSREQIKNDIIKFAGAKPEYWAWYSAYDHVCLAQLFGPMVNLPSNFPYYTLDIKQLHRDKGFPPMPKQPEGRHNALADAQFNIVRYDFLNGLENK